MHIHTHCRRGKGERGIFSLSLGRANEWMTDRISDITQLFSAYRYGYGYSHTSHLIPPPIPILCSCSCSHHDHAHDHLCSTVHRKTSQAKPHQVNYPRRRSALLNRTRQAPPPIQSNPLNFTPYHTIPSSGPPLILPPFLPSFLPSPTAPIRHQASCRSAELSPLLLLFSSFLSHPPITLSSLVCSSHLPFPPSFPPSFLLSCFVICQSKSKS